MLVCLGGCEQSGAGRSLSKTVLSESSPKSCFAIVSLAIEVWSLLPPPRTSNLSGSSSSVHQPHLFSASVSSLSRSLISENNWMNCHMFALGLCSWQDRVPHLILMNTLSFWIFSKRRLHWKCWSASLHRGSVSVPALHHYGMLF